jgi:hypothetical protein
LQGFSTLNNTRQIATTNFQLGSFYTKLCYSKNKKLYSNYIEKALFYYYNAHQYFSKFDVGPTLIEILLDICDLYFYSMHNNDMEFILNEQINNNFYVDNNNNNKNNNNKIFNNNNINNNNNNINNNNISMNKEIFETNIQLLNGIFESILECRCALTTIVLTRYGKVEMEILSIKILKKISDFLLNILKSIKRNNAMTKNNIDSSNNVDNDNNDNDNKIKEKKYIEILKNIYFLLLKGLKDLELNNNSFFYFKEIIEKYINNEGMNNNRLENLTLINFTYDFLEILNRNECLNLLLRNK